MGEFVLDISLRESHTCKDFAWDIDNSLYCHWDFHTFFVIFENWRILLVHVSTYEKLSHVVRVWH
jgi:hypothetical protein